MFDIAREERAGPALAKLTRPLLEGAVARERLFARLDECFRVPVVWIVGPPGAGKTTLASTYLGARKTKHLWVQLDPADSDPASFFFYLRAACEGAGLARKRLPPLLTREYATDVSGFARRTFRALFARLPSGLTLALDNYQAIANDSLVHRALAQACDEIPAGGHLLVLSRVDPPPEYARLAVSERLARIDWEDLKLTREEAYAFARSRAVLSDEAIESLYRNSGGWAAGFTLLRERLARTGCVNPLEIREELQTVFDYFAAEALRDISLEDRQILMETSLMPRFSATMATAVTGKTSAARLLQWLHQRHLFTDRRLSGREVSYQYHALFQSFLKAQAHGHVAPETFAALARRSAQVLEENGQAEEAVEVLIEAGEHEAAGKMLLKLAPSLLASGRGATFLSWTSALPEPARGAGPWLDYWRGQALIGPRLAEARTAFERAYGGFACSRDRTGQALAVVGVLETHFHELVDLKLADPWFEKLPDLFEPEPEFASPDIAAIAYQALLSILFWARPDMDLVHTIAARLEALLAQPLRPIVKLLGAAQLADFHGLGGSLRDSERAIRVGEGLLDHPDITPLARIMWAVRTGWHHLYGGHFETLHDNLARAALLARENGFDFLLHWILGLVADAAVVRGRKDDVRAALAAQREITSSNVRTLGRYEWGCSKLHAMRGEWDEALQRAREAYALVLKNGLRMAQVGYAAQLAQILIERGELAQAQALVAEVGPLYPTERFPAIRFVHTTELLLAYARGERAAWQTSLRELIRFARATGRAFVGGTYPLLVHRIPEMALEAGIEVDYIVGTIGTLGLTPGRPDVPGWPWPAKVHALGAFSIWRDGKPLAFTGKVPKKPLELLQAIIAFGGANVSSEAICHALWRDAEADAAVISLRVTLSRLRKLFGNADLVQLQDGKLSLDRRRCCVDVWALERLLDEIESAVRAGVDGSRRAELIVDLAARLLALYTGPFLRDEREQPWMLPMRERVGSRFVRAAAALGERLEERGLCAEALALYERALAHEPTAERIYRRIMAVHLAVGRKSEAMMTYRRCRQMLSIVLGTQPDAETEALRQAAVQ